MASAMITAFLEAKMKNAKASVALYSVSSDIDGAKIVQDTGIRCNRAIAGNSSRLRAARLWPIEAFSHEVSNGQHQ